MQSVARNLNETYPATPASVPPGAVARLAEFAAAAGATDSQVDAVRLAASEAMTNSVLHAYRGEPGSIYVNAAVVSGELWILISDDGCGLKPRADRPGLGLGLGLISQLSDDCAIVSRPSGGTEVRIRFTLVRAAAESQSSDGARTAAPGRTATISGIRGSAPRCRSPDGRGSDLLGAELHPAAAVRGGVEPLDRARLTGGVGASEQRRRLAADGRGQVVGLQPVGVGGRDLDQLRLAGPT